MKKGWIALIVSLLAICAGIVYIKKKGNIEKTNEKCCETCEEGEDKFSLITGEFCGIVCFKPDELETRRKFQNYIKADEQDCFKLGYTVYYSTSLKGSGPGEIKADLYKKP